MTALRASSTATAPPAAETESKTASCLRSHIGRLRTVSNNHRLTRIQIARNHLRCATVGNADNNIPRLCVVLSIEHEYNAGPLHRPLGWYELDLLRGIPLLAGSKTRTS